jgi:hypothetical protein
MDSSSPRAWTLEEEETDSDDGGGGGAQGSGGTEANEGVNASASATAAEGPPGEDAEDAGRRSSDSEDENPIRAAGPQLGMNSAVAIPKVLTGIEWWHLPLWRAMEHIRCRRAASPKFAINHVSICSGTMSEGYAFKASSVHVMPVY